MRKTLLIVDDNQMMVQFLSRMFEGSYHVLKAGSFETAMGLMASGVRPDVCLFDFNIGDATGLELVRAMHLMGAKYRQIPVMMLSGDKAASVRIACLEAGVADFMLKPFHPQELRLRVERLMGLAAVSTVGHAQTAAQNLAVAMN